MGRDRRGGTIWDQLGLSGFFTGRGRVGFDLAGAVFAMVLNRLTDPSSKRRVIDWLEDDQALPEGFARPELQHLYRALDHLAAAKDHQVHLWSQLTDLANMDLSLVCYDVTSTSFESPKVPSKVFASKAFGYSRDKRSDRAQIVIGLLCVGDGMPIARFPVGRICVVADRGLISTANLDAVQGAGFAHIIATRLHRDKACAAALEASQQPDRVWHTTDWRRWACDVTLDDDARAVVVHSAARARRDRARTAELVARTETALLGLEARVDRGDLVEPPRSAGPRNASSARPA